MGIHVTLQDVLAGWHVPEAGRATGHLGLKLGVEASVGRLLPSENSGPVHQYIHNNLNKDISKQILKNEW